MNFSQRKLGLAVGIISIGMLVALVWHGWQGWGLGKGYPENTFLFKQEIRYTDFTDCLRYTLTADPYQGRMGVCNNFPASYVLLYPFTGLPPTTGAILFLDICMTGLFILLNRVLTTVVHHPGVRMGCVMPFLWSYPVIYALDRGNNDLLLVFCVAVALLLYSQKKFGLSFLFLLPPICVKLYPALLLLLFVRRRLIHWFFLGPLVFVLVSWLALLTFHTPVTESCVRLQEQLSAYNQHYNLEQYGVGASASAWNLFRICVWLVYSFGQNAWTWPMPMAVVTSAFQVYYGIFIGLLLMVLAYALLVETSFARRAALLLLYTTVSAPGGGDYKMMYVGVALILFILMTERRSADLVIVGALALCLIPKREVLLPFVGTSDSGYHDASLNVILNPLCMLIAMALLMKDGWQNTKVPLDWRLAKLAYVLRLSKLYRANFPAPLAPVRPSRRKKR